VAKHGITSNADRDESILLQLIKDQDPQPASASENRIIGQDRYGADDLGRGRLKRVGQEQVVLCSKLSGALCLCCSDRAEAGPLTGGEEVAI
jgi:hypothetical protein